MSNSTQFLTTDYPPLGGKIKVLDEDFYVEEIPRYPASGRGTHNFILMEKKGIGTVEAVDQIARALNIQRKNIGYAGLKDARAVTRQWISIEHMPVERLQNLDIPNIRFIELTAHSNKIKVGHSAGNRFIIKIRNIQVPLPEAEITARKIMSVLADVGVPNFFGPQRFGNTKTNHLLGRALIKNDAEEFIDLFLGNPDETDSNLYYNARKFYQLGNYHKAIESWPRMFYDQRRALRTIVKTRGNKRKAFRDIDKKLKSLLVSAFQSEIFNNVVTARMPHLNKLLLGDFAYKHINGACFQVENPSTEQPRCDSFEISPTGPLIGLRTTRLSGPAGEIENAIIEQAGLTESDLKSMKQLGAKGGRRPLRFQPRNHEISVASDELGQYLELKFELDPGCYATTLIAEITKNTES